MSSFSFRYLFSPKQWFDATKHLTLLQKLVVAALLVALIGTSLWWARSLFYFFTEPSPAHGGHYVEGVVKQPRFINPLLSPRSSVADKTITRLVYSSLFNYNEEGFLEADLADHFERSEDGKEYTVYLRQDVLWHDGERFDADDVVYTGTIAKNPEYGSVGVGSDIRLAWADVTVRKQDDFTVVFALENPRADFLHVLTVGMLPEHLWSAIALDQFNVTDLNAKPVGTGPYEFVDVILTPENTVQEYILRAYKRYHKGEPYITKLSFQVFEDLSSIFAAYTSGKLGGVTLDTPAEVDALPNTGVTESFIGLPSYFAVFFNQTKSVPLAYDEVRTAITLATDRDAIIADVFGVLAQPVDSPLLPDMRGYSEEYRQPAYNPEEAQEKLEEAGWNMGEDGIRKKSDEERLSFTLTVRDESEQLGRVAVLLQEQWRAVGIDAQIRYVNKDELSANIIKPRDYEALLHSQPLRWDQPYLRTLWHSDSREDPGLNFSLLKDDEMDQTLLDLEKETNLDARAKLYETVQKRVLLEDPALFLFAPGFLFAHTDALKGSNVHRVNVSYDRFADVHKWYVAEKRSRKK